GCIGSCGGNTHIVFVMSDQRVEIPGSAPKLRAEERWSPNVNPDEPVTATVVLRRGEDSLSSSQLEERLFSGQFQPISQEKAGELVNADPKDFAALRAFLETHGLRLEGETSQTRTFRI